ncbi:MULTISPECIES: hypothetical protein [Streptomyces]|uniref:hypothetical protein n=1 Tax=Streptomyces TaxID=1883 RepID=UPI001E43B5FA|nr:MULTISPECIES: hypothetical protein [Streptomyces]
MMRRALWQGLLAGAAGVVVMTLGEKAEQRLTGRPSSYVPARTLERLTGMPERPEPRAVNRAMHYGQGALLGVVRSAMAHAGLRGPLASTQFTVVRLTNDQILENATGVGAPPLLADLAARGAAGGPVAQGRLRLRDRRRRRCPGRPLRSRPRAAARGRAAGPAG